MNEPSVCAIMLTANRSAMAKQAVECFRRQTYRNKTLLIVNSGPSPLLESQYDLDMMEPCFIGADAQTVGDLRNRGAREAAGHGTDILIHWDDDDYSHPNRIAEQVALLQSSGADVVGYNEMLFWKETQFVRDGNPVSSYEESTGAIPSEAWLYSNPDQSYALGTSLCYWRKTWERKQFEAMSQGEDWRFIAGLNCCAHSSLPENELFRGQYKYGSVPSDGLPRMIARIHPGNTSNAYTPCNMRSSEWRRVPQWDDYCRKVFA